VVLKRAEGNVEIAEAAEVEASLNDIDAEVTSEALKSYDSYTQAEGSYLRSAAAPATLKGLVGRTVKAEKDSEESLESMQKLVEQSKALAKTVSQEAAQQVLKDIEAKAKADAEATYKANKASYAEDFA